VNKNKGLGSKFRTQPLPQSKSAIEQEPRAFRGRMLHKPQGQYSHARRNAQEPVHGATDSLTKRE